MRWSNIINEALEDDVRIHIIYDSNTTEYLFNNIKTQYENLLVSIDVYKSSLHLPVNVQNHTKSLKDEIFQIQSSLDEILKDSANYAGNRQDLIELFKLIKKYSTEVQGIKWRYHL